MKIIRIGARANHGSRSVELKMSKFRWNPTATSFDLTFTKAACDFATDARHNYTLRYSAKELASQLTMIAEASASMDAEEFAATFSEALPALFRLQMMASGLKLAA